MTSAGLDVPSGVRTRRLHWPLPDGTAEVSLDCDEAGEGPTTLLLPALSSISTRGEMAPLLTALADRHRVVAADWPGFGTLPRPRVDWSPALLSAYLDWLIDEVVRPDAIVAAGHAATYALHACAARPRSRRGHRLALIAPTWRGPLPTMAGSRRS